MNDLGQTPDRTAALPPRGHVVVTGATGLLGQALVRRLLREGWGVTALVRDVPTAARQLGPQVTLHPWSGPASSLANAVSGCDAVINLAGEPIAGRWGATKRQRILSSRVDTTRRVIGAIAAAEQPPRALVSASAVGWYGDRSEEVDESSAPGSGFLAEVCQRWEDEGLRARSHGARVAVLRFGLVLARGGGALPPMLRAARWGVLGRLGTGDQAVAWIHLDDAVDLLVRAIDDPRFDGPLNAVTAQLLQRDLAREIAQHAGRRLGPPTPSWAVRLALGEAASLLLDSSPARRTRLDALGVRPLVPTLAAALDGPEAR